MEIDSIIKALALIIGLVGIPKVLGDLKNLRRSNSREEYRFAKEFLADLDSKELHPYCVDKGYEVIAGSKKLTSEEVKYLLTLVEPVVCIEEYKFTKKIFAPLDTSADLKLVFKKKFRNKIRRKLSKYTFAAGYAVFFFTALSPLLFYSDWDLDLHRLFAYLSLTLPMFGYPSVLCLLAFGQIHRGERLFENQNEHTKRIILHS